MSSNNTPAADSFDPAVDRRLLITGLAGVAGVAALASMAKAGPLTPPGGPVTSTPGPEPRIAVNAQNTPGNFTSVFIISQPGSYYLTGNVQGTAGKHGILINASNVTLDLNGFTVQGVPGTLDGVAGAHLANVTVSNGIVRGWSGAGVTIFGTSTNTVVRNVTAANNAGGGIFVTTAGMVTDCLASGNGPFGISADNNVVVTRCVALNNTTVGIQAVTTCLVSDCMAAGNSRGIEVYDSCTVTRCTVASNSAEGIRALVSNTITDNTVRVSNIGVRVVPGAGYNRVERNTAVSCATSYAAESAFNFFAGNLSASTPTHWNMSSTNYIRAVVGASTAAFTGSSGGSAVGGTLNDPYLNIALT